MRLIDVDAIKCNGECQHCQFYKGYDFDGGCEIYEQPTAYDVDRVLEELNEEYELWLRGYNQTLSMGIDSLWRDLSGRAYGVSVAIEIVKGGWVDDR